MSMIKKFKGISDDFKVLFCDLADKAGVEIKGCIGNYLHKNWTIEASGTEEQFRFFEYLFKKYGACLTYIAKQLSTL